jgi:hypothetical protein
MLNVTVGDKVYNHWESARNVEAEVTKVTKGFVWITVKGCTTQGKYNRRTGMLVNQSIGQNDYITIEKEI